MSEGYSSKPMQATKIGDRIVRVDAVQKARGEPLLHTKRAETGKVKVM